MMATVVKMLLGMSAHHIAFLSLSRASCLHPSFLIVHPGEAADEASGGWVSAICVGEPTWGSGFLAGLAQLPWAFRE